MTRSIGKRIQLGLAVTVLGVGLATGTAVALEGCSNSDCGEVLPSNDQQVPPGNVGATEGATVSQPSSTSGGVLPFTGADIVEFSVVGLGAIGAGSILVRRNRAQRVAS